MTWEPFKSTLPLKSGSLTAQRTHVPVSAYYLFLHDHGPWQTTLYIRSIFSSSILRSIISILYYCFRRCCTHFEHHTDEQVEPRPSSYRWTAWSSRPLENHASFSRNLPNIPQIDNEKPKKCQHVTGSTWNHEVLDRWCPKSSVDSAPYTKCQEGPLLAGQACGYMDHIGPPLLSPWMLRKHGQSYIRTLEEMVSPPGVRTLQITKRQGAVDLWWLAGLPMCSGTTLDLHSCHHECCGNRDKK